MDRDTGDPGQVHHGEIRNTTLLYDESEGRVGDPLSFSGNLASGCTDGFGDAGLRCGDGLVFVLEQQLRLGKGRVVLEAHDKGNAGADALAAG